MSDHPEFIKSLKEIKSTLEVLLRNQDKQRAEILEQQRKIEVLSSQKAELENKVQELEQRINILKLAKRIGETNEKTTDVKYRINEIVRELDKCIGMMKA